jgi:hypothetical protein
MIGIFNEHLTLSVGDEHMLNIVERPGGFWVEILEKNFHTIAAITTEMATELAEWINNHQGNPDKQHTPTTGTKKNMKIDNPKGRAWWEWARTANPWLPPYEKLDPAQIRADMFEVALTVHLEHPPEPFRWYPWDEAVAAHLAPIEGDSAPADWTRHLTTAVVLLMYALQCDDAGDGDTRRVHIAHAAARIHVMAPEGTKWNEPIPLVPGGERPRLRSVVRALLEADASHRHQNEGSVTYRLVSAEASLHGLWLAADKEE